MLASHQLTVKQASKKQAYRSPQKVAPILMSKRTVEDSRRFDHFPLSVALLPSCFPFRTENLEHFANPPLSNTLLSPSAPLSKPADQPKFEIEFASPASRHPLRDTDSRTMPVTAPKSSPGGGDCRRRPVLSRPAAEITTESKEKISRWMRQTPHKQQKVKY